MDRLKGKVALITGGAGGQGTEEALLFAREGAAIVIGDVADEKGEELVKRIRETGAEALYVHLDVTSQRDWDSAVGSIKEKLGALHILINNAGINGPGVIPNVDIAQWERVLKINLTGSLMGIQSCAALMRDSGGGSIINVGSTTGLEGHWIAAYSASKWGLRALTRSAAIDLAPWNIRCNTLCPGLVNTPMSSVMPPAVISQFHAASAIPRGCEPEEIAYAALFLASDESSFITGIDLPIDGGFSGVGVYGQIKAAADRAGQAT